MQPYRIPRSSAEWQPTPPEKIEQMLYPLKFRPRLKKRIWGGRLLSERLGKRIPKDAIMGESWEISGVDGDISIVSNGPLAGNNLEELIEVYMGELVGDRVYEKFGLEFPLLIKYIDAQDKLSVQVHPDDKLAAERHFDHGKTEMWYILEAAPDAELYIGFKDNLSQETYNKHITSHTLPETLSTVHVNPGEAFFIPAGTVHSIGKGILLAEIQQTSDITYRIYDYGRPGLDGKPRELHTEQAKSAIDYRVHEDYRTRYVRKMNEEVSLVNCCHFNTSLLEMDEPFVKDMSGMDSFLAAVCIDGEGTVSDSEGNTVDISCGETVLIPACMSSAVFRPQGGRLQMLLTSCPSQI